MALRSDKHEVETEWGSRDSAVKSPTAPRVFRWRAQRTQLIAMSIALAQRPVGVLCGALASLSRYAPTVYPQRLNQQVVFFHLAAFTQQAHWLHFAVVHCNTYNLTSGHTVISYITLHCCNTVFKQAVHRLNYIVVCLWANHTFISQITLNCCKTYHLWTSRTSISYITLLCCNTYSLWTRCTFISLC